MFVVHLRLPSQLLPLHSACLQLRLGGSLCAWRLQHFGQHTAKEGEQLLWRVEAQHLARTQMLDPAFPGQRLVCGLGAKLDHKGPIGW